MVTTADLTGSGRTAWPKYWPPAATSGHAAPKRCSDVRMLAASPAALPATGRVAEYDGFAKVLVAYTGKCGNFTWTAADPGIE